MEKRLVYPQYNIRGQRDVYSVTEDRRWLQKTAGGYHPEIQKYIQNAKPIPDLIQVLLTALGAHEYWGQNVNGDRFYEAALKNPGDDYGYKTFLSNANYFTHHVNKDPALAKGKVLATVWNDGAKRVELIVGINPSLDPDAASMLDNGEALCFSMGARLPFDVCTVCGNKARTRAEYCDHLKYQMNQIDPETGVLVGAINPTPKFFDISRVLIPADKTAYMWEKIAHAANSPLSKVGSAQLASMTIKQALAYEPEFRKTASVQKKTAEIKKQIIAISHPKSVEKLRQVLSQVKQALDMTSPEIPMEIFRNGPSFDKCLGSMTILGIAPTASERASLVELFTSREDKALPQVHPHSIDIDLIKKLLPYAEQRSLFRPVLYRRLIAVEKTAGALGGGIAAVAKSIANIGKAAGTGAVRAAKAVTPTVRAVTPSAETVGSALKGAANLVDSGLAITKGFFQSVGAVLGVTPEVAHAAASRTTKEMPSGLAATIANYPIIAGLLAALVLKGSATKPLVSGNFTVADPTQGLYNNDWQRRFVEMQNRPVAVIKTGAAQEQANMLVSPLTYLLMTVDIVKTAGEQRTWEMVADQFLNNLQSPENKKIVKTAMALFPEDRESMMGAVPELADLELIKQMIKFNK